jgi:hypothetical protein
MLRIETEPKVKMTMTVKKDKVKVKKSHPLKGAIIDVDCNTELIEVIGEKEGFEEKPVDLFSEENAIIDDEKELIEELKKNDDEDMEDLRMLKELEDAEELIRQQKQELIKKREIKKNANKYKSHIVNMLEKNIESNKEAIKKFQDENLRLQEKLLEIDSITSDTDIMDYLAISFADEFNELIEKDTPKPVKAKKQKSPIVDDGKEKPERKAAILRKYQWENIPDGTEFELIYKKAGIRYTKSKGKIFRNDTGVEYAGFNEAVNDYQLKTYGKKVSLNAWLQFKHIN